MKSPTELSERFAKQWQNGGIREQRLLSTESWPIQLSIGLPSAKIFSEQPSVIREHVAQWRNIKTGKIGWTGKKYISSSDKIQLPEYWQINSPSEWIAASESSKVQQEYKILEKIISSVDSLFHGFIIRKRTMIISKPIDEVIRACQIALTLGPNYAQGKPLRALSIENCDSKFYERHRNLVIQLMDIRFDGAVSELGLEQFLAAADEKDHWLLVAPLDANLLPFQQCRIRTSELVKVELPASFIIIVENEQCLHQLPSLSNTIAILGAGLDLSWLKADWLAEKTLAYWGDIDTWGLTILAKARVIQPRLTALLMNPIVFHKYSKQFAVMEPQKASLESPIGLSQKESEFYSALYHASKGRLEQEFLPKNEVINAFSNWHKVNLANCVVN